MQLDLHAISTTITRLSMQVEHTIGLADEAAAAIRPFTREFGGAAREELTDAARLRLGLKLENVATRYGAMGASIDRAFGSGTWMSAAATAEEAFHLEAARVMRSGGAEGVSVADHAVELLRQNLTSTGTARSAFQRGNIVLLADQSRAATVVAATPERFEQAAAWGAMFARAT